MKKPIYCLSVYRKKIAQLNTALQMSGDNFHLGTVTELNNRLTELLEQINKNGELLALLAPELRSLYASHQVLIKNCEHMSEKIKKKMDDSQQNKEGVLAYQSVGVQR